MTTLSEKVATKTKRENEKNVPIKCQPFIYLLDDTNEEINDIDKRFKTIAKKNMVSTQYLASNPTGNQDNKIYNNTYIYGMLPEFLFPAAYIPFNNNNVNENFYRLTFQDKALNDYYEQLFNDIPNKKDDKGKDTSEKDIDTFKQSLRTNLKETLDNLNNNNKVYNIFSIKKLMIFCGIFWFIILLFILKVLHYYYFTSYNYVIFVAAIILLLLAVLWKMVYTLQ